MYGDEGLLLIFAQAETTEVQLHQSIISSGDIADQFVLSVLPIRSFGGFQSIPESVDPEVGEGISRRCHTHGRSSRRGRSSIPVRLIVPDHLCVEQDVGIHIQRNHTQNSLDPSLGNFGQTSNQTRRSLLQFSHQTIIGQSPCHELVESHSITHGAGFSLSLHDGTLGIKVGFLSLFAHGGSIQSQELCHQNLKVLHSGRLLGSLIVVQHRLESGHVDHLMNDGLLIVAHDEDDVGIHVVEALGFLIQFLALVLTKVLFSPLGDLFLSAHDDTSIIRQHPTDGPDDISQMRLGLTDESIHHSSHISDDHRLCILDDLSIFHTCKPIHFRSSQSRILSWFDTIQLILDHVVDLFEGQFLAVVVPDVGLS